MGLGVGLGWEEATRRMIPKLVSPALFCPLDDGSWLSGQGMQSSADSVMSIVWRVCPSWAQPEFSGHCVQYLFTDAKKILELGVF